MDDDKIAESLDNIASALRSLGTADAATPMGAVELLAMEVKGVGEALNRIADAITELSNDRSD